MRQDGVELTAVFLERANGYVGYFQELPGISAHGRTLQEARDSLRRITVVVFDEERRCTRELLAGKPVLRELFVPRQQGRRGT